MTVPAKPSVLTCSDLWHSPKPGSLRQSPAELKADNKADKQNARRIGGKKTQKTWASCGCVKSSQRNCYSCTSHSSIILFRQYCQKTNRKHFLLVPFKYKPKGGPICKKLQMSNLTNIVNSLCFSLIKYKPKGGPPF